jgi:hypothetical protein
VRKALEWLKENNPLFANVTISPNRLAQLPEDDVPYELRMTAKLSTDINSLHAEQEGYVPSRMMLTKVNFFLVYHVRIMDINITSGR